MGGPTGTGKSRETSEYNEDLIVCYLMKKKLVLYRMVHEGNTVLHKCLSAKMRIITLNIGCTSATVRCHIIINGKSRATDHMVYMSGTVCGEV
jgi:hypothetical protein